jgi:omega-amidase
MSVQKNLKISIVQASLVWENKGANLRHLGELIADSQNDSDIIVLPEMFSTGFSMNAKKLAESDEGGTLAWMKELAQKSNSAVVGSFIAKVSEGVENRFYNRLHWVEPSGIIRTYDKRHLFSFAGEANHYSAGKERLIVEYKGWRICPMVCYDLRFPVWSRNASLDGESDKDAYDLLIYVANWPEARNSAWINLLEARSHENQAYVVGVNRVGKDGNGINHIGNSAIFSPKGELLSKRIVEEEAVQTVEVGLYDLINYREKFRAWGDKDVFELKQ